MFERYTEKARRVIFFARYEASQYGSPYIGPEHLLLGLLREDKRAFAWIPKLQTPATIRQRIETWTPKKPPTPTSVDLPLDGAAKHILHQAKEEADRLNAKHIGTEHLFLALLQETDWPTAKLLQEFGADLDKLRVKFAGEIHEPESSIADRVRDRLLWPELESVSIHGKRLLLRATLAAAQRYREQHWRKQSWIPRDVVVEKKTGKPSFDLGLAEDSEHFELVKNGWKKDHCVICHWELFESQDGTDRSTGYTNGRDWICLECYENFWSRPDFISGSYSDIT
jgi:ClpA/ClpB-like protein